MGAAVFEPVSLLEGSVAAPVADFDVPFEEGGVDEGLCELVPYAGILLGASGNVLVRTVGVCGALALGLAGVVGDVDAGEFYFGLLVLGQVG